MMNHRGISHIGLSTLDLDKTRAFYEGILGFKPVAADTITIEEGGHLRHLFFDIGDDQLIAFLEPTGVPGIPEDYDAGINRRLGVPAGFYHFAFEAGSPAGLVHKRDELRAKGVDSPTSSITNGPSRSTSRIRTGSRSSIAAPSATAPRVTRGCMEPLRSTAPPWSSAIRSSPIVPRRDRLAASVSPKVSPG
jgi:catechol 2,3-dioxygenase-like lactoylglutathione lyase family enzyme